MATRWPGWSEQSLVILIFRLQNGGGPYIPSRRPILPELPNSDPHRAWKIDSGGFVDRTNHDHSQEIPDFWLSCQRSLFPCVGLKNTSLVLEP